MNSFVALSFITYYCSVGLVHGSPQICDDGNPPHHIELNVLHSPDCTTMGEGCKFDYLVELSVDDKVRSSMPVENQAEAKALLLAVQPMFGGGRK